jgi:hypothetical protein
MMRSLLGSGWHQSALVPCLIACQTATVPALPVLMPLSQDQNQTLLDQNGIGVQVWQTTVHVERTVAVEALPERIWSLLRSAAAWSALPDVTYAFDIAGSPRGVGHVIVATGAALDSVGSRLLDVLTVCAEVPGQMISARSAARSGQECVYVLSIDSGQRDVKVRAAVRQACARPAKTYEQERQQKRLSHWLRALQAILDGRASWPAEGLSAEIQAVYAAQAEVTDPVSVSAEVLIKAPAAMVWQAIRSLEAKRLALQVPYVGCVPGTPQGAIGEIRYVVHRHADNELHVGMTVVRELVAERCVREQSVGSLHDELGYVVVPVGEGTRLEVVSRVPVQQFDGGEDRLRTYEGRLRRRLDSYRALIEEQPGWPADPLT